MGVKVYLTDKQKYESLSYDYNGFDETENMIAPSHEYDDELEAYLMTKAEFEWWEEEFEKHELANEMFEQAKKDIDDEDLSIFVREVSSYNNTDWNDELTVDGLNKVLQDFGYKTKKKGKIYVIVEKLEEQKKPIKRLKETKLENYKILVTSCYADVYEDSWEDGELDMISTWDMDDIKKAYNSIEDLIKNLSGWGFSEKIKDYYFDDSRSMIISDVLVDKDAYTVSPKDDLFKQWKAGKINLYNASLFCEVKIIAEKDMTDEDAKMLGLSIL